MNKRDLGTVLQFAAVVLMSTGLIYELLKGESIGWWIFSAGCLVTVIANKLQHYRGK